MTDGPDIGIVATPVTPVAPNVPTNRTLADEAVLLSASRKRKLLEQMLGS
eukprot:CAMPEP_0115839024 /NCGR_PEP_ID=MMETSP0287-20121206/6040_1 /TAXON_ID=412157 /ORGANISM="Chrysochromulina rotalis, Strain UIO044" /LENGTH=49 /DNA_ID=CAMNT_0003292587 /DNA_START=84 /DNA_END=233 /DNA_ORIENTATION=+